MAQNMWVLQNISKFTKWLLSVHVTELQLKADQIYCKLNLINTTLFLNYKELSIKDIAQAKGQ